ncbi:uncharacterized protein LOC129588684 isoform X2 [Paramacrobiotus metropolitanus]|nr:uncharacterized protein LOC129588684 isoform X2 [Paramacrobiotus metropolitanus]
MSRNVCRGRTGYVADTSRNCQVFYNCLPDGTITTSTCPGDYLFDETTQCCKMPHDVNCAGYPDANQGAIRPTVSCMGKRGFYPDLPSGCRIFYFCEPSGRSRQLSCPDGLLFNEIIGCCDIAQNVRCGGAPLPPSTSPVPVDGGEVFCRSHPPGFYMNPTDCSTYFYCQNSNRHNLLRCPNGQAFNELTSSCDNDLSRCNGVQIDRRVFDCTGRSGWYSGSDPNCQYAFYCNAGIGYMHRCQGNLRWNAFTLSCEPRERVQCPRNGNTGSGQTVVIRPPITPVTTGTIAPPQRPGSYGPATQNPYGDYLFTTQQPWNYGNGGGVLTYPSVTTTVSTYYTYSSTQHTTNTNPGLGIDRTYDCRGKIGYYAVVESGCSQFIYCNPEGIAHRFACPSILLFNNSLSVCDWPQNVRCQNQYTPGFLPNTLTPPNFDCRGKNGFFADRTRGSRLFYLCHSDGGKFQYVCPANLVFNEQTSVCDWPDYMKQTGFTSGSQTGGRTQTSAAQVEWNGPALDCRLRPAGFYANPNNNQVYARCTPDGTFIAMPCPQATVFDQGLGLCVFPYQVGQAQTYQGNYGSSTNTGGSYNSNVNGNTGGADYQGNYQVRPTSTEQYQPRPVPNTATFRPPPVVTTTSYVAQLRPYTGPGSGQQPPSVTTVGYSYNEIEENNNNNDNINYNNNQYQYSTEPEPSGFPGTYPPYTPPQSPPPPVAPVNQNFQSGNNIDSFFQGEEYNILSGSNQFSPQNQNKPDYGYGQVQQGNVNYQQTGQSFNYQFQGGNYGGQQQQQQHPGYVPTSQQTPAVCLGAAGLYADRASSCRRYFVCQSDGSGSIRVCPGTSVFNELTGKCENSRNVNCFSNAPGIVQPSVPVCMNGNNANKFVPDPTKGCMTFYNCEQNGRGTGFRCPAGMQFNPKINACDDPRNCNCAPENGGTINIKIPVPTTVVTGTSDIYRSNLQQYSGDYSTANQNMDLDIRVRRPVVTSGMLPLVPGYDSSLYADASGSHARLPTFFSDDDSLGSNASSIVLDIVIGPPSKENTTLVAANTTQVPEVANSNKVSKLEQADDALPGDNYFRINRTKNKSLEKIFKIFTERHSKDSLS